MQQHSEFPALDQHLVYQLSFTAFLPRKLSEQPVQYINLSRCSRVHVPSGCVHLAGAHDAPFSLVLYHLLRYSLDTFSNEEGEEGEDRRIDAAVETIRGWGMRREWE